MSGSKEVLLNCAKVLVLILRRRCGREFMYVMNERSSHPYQTHVKAHKRDSYDWDGLEHCLIHRDNDG